MILIGHNGAGKSTLIHYLLGFYTHTTQHPFLVDFKHEIKPLNRFELGYAPEMAHLDLSMSAKDYLAMMATLKGVSSYDIKALLNMVKLDVDAKKAIKTYSKGMRQRLLLALALLGRPKTIILDEPTSGLDPFGREAVEELLIALKKEHRFIISTHSLRLAVELEDEVWILKEGKIVHKAYFESEEALSEVLHHYKPEVIQ